MFDLCVAYRIYPRLSGNRLVHFDSKIELVRENLTQFKAALGNLNAYIKVFLDKCPYEYKELVWTIFPDAEIEVLDGVGNGKSFIKQLDFLLNQTYADKVYFAEDDYLYAPGAIEKLHRIGADFATPVDDMCYYHRQIDQIQRQRCRGWKTVLATTMSFMADKQALQSVASCFYRYDKYCSDLAIWMAITKERVFNPFNMLHAIADGRYIAISWALAWLHCWKQILFGKRYALWAPEPSLAMHIQSQSTGNFGYSMNRPAINAMNPKANSAMQTPSPASDLTSTA